MHVVIAPGRLKDGISEEAMLAASDRFQREFAAHQPGILRRVVVGGDDRSYADIVFFADEAAIADVMVAEQSSEVCHEFMSMWEGTEVMLYRVLQTHD